MTITITEYTDNLNHLDGKIYNEYQKMIISII